MSITPFLGIGAPDAPELEAEEELDIAFSRRGKTERISRQVIFFRFNKIKERIPVQRLIGCGSSTSRDMLAPWAAITGTFALAVRLDVAGTP